MLALNITGCSEKNNQISIESFEPKLQDFSMVDLLKKPLIYSLQI